MQAAQGTKALIKKLRQSLSIFIMLPFAGVKRMRILLEIEHIKTRIIAQENFLRMYQNRISEAVKSNKPSKGD